MHPSSICRLPSQTVCLKRLCCACKCSCIIQESGNLLRWTSVLHGCFPCRLAAQVSQYYADVEELESISQLRKYLGQVSLAIQTRYQSMQSLARAVDNLTRHILLSAGVSLHIIVQDAFADTNTTAWPGQVSCMSKHRYSCKYAAVRKWFTASHCTWRLVQMQRATSVCEFHICCINFVFVTFQSCHA